jgi:hypothetical protein
MRRFLVEISVPQADATGLERATRTLWTAHSRLSGNATTARLVTVGAAEDDGRLVCLIEAPTIDAVHSLVALAFLSTGRIREVTASDVSRVVGGTPRARRQNPSGDLGSGVESQLVEDVVDVGLDGALGDE